MRFPFINSKRNDQLSPEAEAQILRNILARSGKDLNTISLDALRSYSNYRMERYTLARVLITLILILFLLLPLLFFRPRLIVQERTDVLANRRAYNITVESLIPIRQITAVQNERTVPVYEAAGTQYIILPNENGDITVSVTLKNGQRAFAEISVSGIDHEPPVVIETKEVGKQLYIYLSDDSDIDPGTIDIITAAGVPANILRYISADKCIVIDMPSESMKLTVSDIFGNTLTINLNQ